MKESIQNGITTIKQFQLFWIVSCYNSLTVGTLSALGHGRKFDD